MARRGIKKKDYERLDDSTVSRVVSLLEQNTPITKKAACEILNISYNTMRLNKIIQEYKDKLEFRERRMKQNRGKPFTDMELKELIVNYLSGSSITLIAKDLFRSVHVIKSKIKELNLPERDTDHTYQKPGLTPDEMVSEKFTAGELVWSARYNCVAEIKQEWGINKFDTENYAIWVFGKYNQYAYQPWWELGKLNVLEKLNINKTEFEQTQAPQIIYRIQ